MMAVPLFWSKLEAWTGFQVICSSPPSIEEVPAPSLGRNPHGMWPLAMSIAVEPRVAQAGAQERPGSGVVEIRNAHGDTFAVLVRRSGLRDERVDVGKLRSLGERVDVYRQQMLWRQDRLKAAK